MQVFRGRLPGFIGHGGAPEPELQDRVIKDSARNLLLAFVVLICFSDRTGVDGFLSGVSVGPGNDAKSVLSSGEVLRDLESQ